MVGFAHSVGWRQAPNPCRMISIVLGVGVNFRRFNELKPYCGGHFLDVGFGYITCGLHDLHAGAGSGSMLDNAQRAAGLQRSEKSREEFMLLTSHNPVMDVTKGQSHIGTRRRGNNDFVRRIQ